MTSKKSDVLISIGGDISSLNAALDKSAKNVESFKSRTVKSLTKIGGSLAKLGTGAAVAGLATATATFAKFSAEIDKVAKTSDKLGIATEKLIALRYAADQTGAGAENLDKSIEKMSKRISDFGNGAGPAKKSLEELGLTYEMLKGLAPDQQFALIAERMKGVADQSDKVRLAFNIFGKSGTDLVNTLAVGADGLAAYEERARALGITLTRIDAAKVEQANDAFDDLQRIGQAAGQQFTVALSPAVKAFSQALTNAAIAGGGMGNIMTKVVDAGVKGFAFFADAVRGLKVVFKGLELVGATYKAFFLSMIQGVAEAFTGFTDAVISDVNSIITTLNKLPNVNIATVDPLGDSPFMASLRQMAGTARAAVSETRNELHNLAMTPMPSQGINEGYEKAKQKMQAQAEQTAANASSQNGELTPEEQLEKYKEQLAATELARQEAEALKLANIEAEKAKREALEKKHMDALKGINERGFTALSSLQTLFDNSTFSSKIGALQSLNNAQNVENKKHFDRQKKLNLALAAASLPMSVLESFRNGGGYPWGLVPAGLMAAAGLKQINNIRKASFSGGSSGASSNVSAGSSAASTSPPQAAPQESRSAGILTVEGFESSKLYSGSRLTELAEMLNQHSRNGGTTAFI